MSQELVGRLDEVLATIASVDAGWEAHGSELRKEPVCPENVFHLWAQTKERELDLAEAAVSFLRTHGQQIRKALAGAGVAGDGSDAVDFDIIDRLLDEHGCDCKPTSQDSIDCFDQRDKLRTYRATRPAPVRDGWRMVPVEPTEAMLIRGALAYEQSGYHDLIGPLGDAYAAMLAAAQPPAPEPFGADFIRSIEP